MSLLTQAEADHFMRKLYSEASERSVERLRQANALLRKIDAAYAPAPYVWHSVAALIDGAPEEPVQSLEEKGLRVRSPQDYTPADPPWRQAAQKAWTEMADVNLGGAQKDMQYIATPVWGEKSKVDPYAQPGAVVSVDPPKGPSPWRHVIFALIVLMGVLGIVLMAAPR
jgi:hypothetical protein